METTAHPGTEPPASPPVDPTVQLAQAINRLAAAIERMPKTIHLSATLHQSHAGVSGGFTTGYGAPYGHAGGGGKE